MNWSSLSRQCTLCLFLLLLFLFFNLSNRFSHVAPVFLYSLDYFTKRLAYYNYIYCFFCKIRCGEDHLLAK
jgi:hypothetical protein